MYINSVLINLFFLFDLFFLIDFLHEAALKLCYEIFFDIFWSTAYSESVLSETALTKGYL